MLRKQNIYNELRSGCKNITYGDISNGNFKHLTTEAIAIKLGLLRNNVSHDLNSLNKEGKVIRIKSRPVIFLDKNTIEDKFNVKVSNIHLSNTNDLLNLINCKRKSTTNCSKNSIVNNIDIVELIGYDGSLRKQIEQGKAAILYPPNGLHMMLIGATGVGKSLFAKALYNYGIKCGKYTKDTPFITFNCADYSNNPQLLLSHLFGHIKGAFTGADKEKTGLIEKANEGILFLDEIHRLPREGQEMFFSILDNGVFRKLGETNVSNNINVVIIGATTENTDDVLLKTFLRRIPIVIKFPDLKERPLSDKEMLVKRFFWQESKNLKNNISIPKDIIAAFILYDCPSNIGQLKSDIQQVCAKAYLNFITNKAGDIEITSKILVDEVRNTLLNLYTNLADKNLSESVFNANGVWSTSFYEDEKDKNILIMDNEYIEQLHFSFSYLDEISKVYAKVFHENDYKLIFNNFKEKMKKGEIPACIIETSKLIKDYIEEATKTSWENTLIVFMSCYLSLFIDKNDYEYIEYKKELIIDEDSEYYNISNRIINICNRKLNFEIPDSEVNTVYLLIKNYDLLENVHKKDTEKIFEENEQLDTFEQQIMRDAFNYIKENIVFVNPYIVYKLILEAISNIEKEFIREFEISNRLKLVIHISFAVERILSGNDVPYKDVDLHSKKYEKELNKIKKSLLNVETEFLINFTNDELSYIYDIFK